jgi:quinoprotein glucose dehydrogenase
MNVNRAVISACILFCAPSVVFTPQPANAGERDEHPGEWRYYAKDPGSTKYSPLDQINRENVSRLSIAWTWTSPDMSLQKNRRYASFAYETTPLMVGGRLFASTSLVTVAAIDAETGRQIWAYDPESYKLGRPCNLGFVNRGVAYWTDGKEERILFAPHDAYLRAVDAKTGKLITSFGENGKVDLVKAIPLAIRGANYTVTSPPIICRDVVIVGSSISDGPQYKEFPRGDVQAFDVRTGKPLWIFHAIAQGGEFGADTWKNDAWKYTGSANVWTLMTFDEETGYVYLPFSTPTNDWYGGHRPGNGLFSESLVCVDAKTGKRIWHFQAVHHGLWDYDLPAAPVLCTIRVDGRTIKAVAQITKSGFVFVFDRTNGKPVWPIEERPVPQSTVPGEQTSPTQPFPTRPAPFETQGATEENLIDFTPELHTQAKKILDQYTHGPLFTPPTNKGKGTINLPGWAGGANWWGAAFDPDTGMFYVPSITMPIQVKLNKPDPARSNFDWVRGGPAYALGVEGPKHLPLFKPPYGRVTAYNLNTGEKAWMVPHGDGPRKLVSSVVGKDVGPLGSGGGGPLLTKTLLFIGQGAGGRGGRAGGGSNVIRAFDKANGKVIAQIPIPAPPSGTPMTYMAGGRQFIVIATIDGKLVALSLPAEKSHSLRLGAR